MLLLKESPMTMVLKTHKRLMDKYKAIKIYRDIADQIQVITSHQGTSIAEYVSTLIRAHVQTDYENTVDAMKAEIEQRKQQERESKKKRKPTEK